MSATPSRLTRMSRRGRSQPMALCVERGECPQSGGLGKPAVAAVLLCLWVALTPGCLVPQNNTVLTDAGPPLNHPPRFAEEQMPLSRVKPASVNQACATGTLTFQALVDEPDLTDDTHWRIYLDWDPTTNAPPIAADVVLGSADNSARIRTVPPTPFPIRVDSTTPLGTVGTHLVELWMTDGPADNIASRRPAIHPAELPDGGSYDSYYVATYAWLVNVRGDCQ